MRNGYKPSAEMSPPRIGDLRTAAALDVSARLWCKGVFDRLLAALVLVPALPILALLWFLRRVTSAGPWLLRQRRVGRGGRIFTMYTIRTWRLNGREALGPSTDRLGGWLEKMRLHGLPQLFNVLRGEMSLVGPRPDRPECHAVLAEQIPGYCDRLSVAPGLVGLAQLSLPADSDLDSARPKLAMDLEYIRRAGLLLDCRVLLAWLCRCPGILRTSSTAVEAQGNA
jgi:lipopolysaccharide/colanic/teichoic acid biosynthesis glycosyltransferase